MDDIAALAGVSKPTVSRALQDSPLVNAKTKAHVLKVAERHGYVVNRNAQNLRRQRNDVIALAMDYSALPDHRLTDPFHFQLLANVANALAARNLDLLMCSPQHAKYEVLLTSKSADGLLLVGQTGREDMLRRLARAGVPFVVWGSPTPEGGYSVVGSDNALGGRLAARRFLELGRRRPAFLGPPGHPEITARRAGFGEEWAKSSRGAKVRDIPVPDFSFEAGLAAARAALTGGAPAPDAIFCASDMLAIATLAVLRESGIDVPSACSVIGFDDGPSAVLHVPPLTTIRQDTRMAGAVWVETLMQVISGAAPRPVLLPVELIVRGT